MLRSPIVRHATALVLLALAGCAPPLIRAARSGDAASAAALLSHGADPDARSPEAGAPTALAVAASRGDLKVAALLLDHGAKVDAPDARGATPLMRASAAGRVEMIKLLLARGADVDAADVQKTTALHFAAQNGDLDAARALLDHGARVDAADEMTLGRTPLGVAAYFGDEPMVRLLLDRGADPRIPGNNGRTPEKQAVWQGHFRLARMLKGFSEGKPFAPAAEQPPTPVAPSNADAPAYRLPRDERLVGVAVGVGESAGLPASPFAEHDAQAVRAHLLALGATPDHAILLTGILASRAGLAKNLESRLPLLVDKRSTVVFYFSGRAAADPKTGEVYLVPSDGDPQYLAQTAYPLSALLGALASSGAARVAAILDCALPAGQAPRPPAGVSLLLAAAPGKTAGSRPEQGHGELTYELLRGLNGQAKDAAGAITLESLRDFAASNAAGRAQEPELLGAAGLRLR